MKAGRQVGRRPEILLKLLKRKASNTSNLRRALEKTPTTVPPAQTSISLHPASRARRRGSFEVNRAAPNN